MTSQPIRLHASTHLPQGQDPLQINPNLICDDVIPNAFEYPWAGSGSYTTTFANDSVSLHQSAFGGAGFRSGLSSLPVISDEWAEFAFELSVDTITGYSASANLLALIRGAAVNGSSISNSCVELLASHVGGVLKFRAGTVTVTSPTGTGSFTDNLTTSSLALAANTVYDVTLRARETPQTLYSQLIVNEVLLLNLTLANPVGGSGGLTETGLAVPEWGISSSGTGTPPTWTFDSFRYAIKSTDRRPCSTIFSPFA